MTIEQILEIIERYKLRIPPTVYYELLADIREAEEPTTKNDLEVDLISRADAIQAMQDKAKKLTNEDTINGLCGAVAILFELPSVTSQEPKTGHWIVAKGSYLGMRNACCSNCKDFYSNDWNVMSYCPNCGANMVEPQESEEK